MNAEKIHRMMLALAPEDSRAWKIPYDSDLWRLLRAIAQGYARVADDADNILDALLPDNDNFTADDATAWERRLGLKTDSSVSLENRKKAISRKMAHPGGQPARQHYLFIEDQLRQAGFDVHVYENRFDDGMGGLLAKSPAEILGVEVGNAILDEFSLDEMELDASWSDADITIVANKLNAEDDEDFSFGTTFRRTFIVAGDAVDEFADVEAARETELRELILKLKPVESIGILFVNYV